MHTLVFPQLLHLEIKSFRSEKRKTVELLIQAHTFLLLAASSACFTNAMPSVVTCWEEGKKIKMSKARRKQKQTRTRNFKYVQIIKGSKRIKISSMPPTCLNMLDTGSKPRGILENSLNILDKSSH